MPQEVHSLGTTARDGGLHRGPIWICITVLTRCVPLVLGSSKGNHRDWPFETMVRLTPAIVKRNVHGVRIVVVLVNQQERPLAIWTERR